MNDLNGGLNFTSGIDNSKLVTDAAKAKATLKGIGDTAVVQGSAVQNAFNSAYGLIAAGAVASIGMLGREILNTTAKFEKFGIVLRNTLGDAAGNDALAMIANFAATTPFQLDEVTAAFIKMANQGFVPTREEMVKLGDIASSTGKNFDLLAEAILDAQTGEFERLKEFGIKASSAGDKVTFSFKEQQTTVDKTNSSIRGYILSLGDLNGIAGANAKISESLTGQMSNLGDKIAAMYNEIGTANKGILYAVVGGAATMVENYATIGEAIGLLITIYGVQKVAVMAVAYAEGMKAAAMAKNIAIESAYQTMLAERNIYMIAQSRNVAVEIIQQQFRAKATQQVIAAELELQAAQKKSALTNPYVLAAMAVAALGYAIYKVVSYQTDLEKASEKAANQLENEKDKTAQLFAELKQAKEGTDEWKKSKDAILNQYGTYLTEQQKELLGTKDQAIAQTAVNDGLRENIALKVKQESLDSISSKYNPQITGGVKDLQGLVKKELGTDRAAEVGQEIAPLIASIKIAVDPEDKAKAEKELNDYFQKLRSEIWGDKSVFNRTGLVSNYQSEIQSALRDWKEETDATNKAFNVQSKDNEEAKVDPVLTTYAAQIEVLKGKKKIAQKELEALKKTPGEDPMKAIDGKQKEIDEINKQLGIKDKAAKEEKEAIKSVVEASKEYLDIQQQILDKTNELNAANKAGNSDKGLDLNKDIRALEKQRDLLVKGGEKIDPLGATVATKIPGNKLKPMKELTAEQYKQLQAAAKQADIEEAMPEKLQKEAQLRQDVAFAASELGQILAANGMISREAANAISDTMSAIASGDPLQMTVQAIAMIASMFPSQAEEFQNRIDKINVALKEQARLIDLAGRFGGEETARKKELSELQKLKAEQEAQLARAEEKRDNKVFKVGPVYKGYVRDVNELTAALVETNNQIEDAEVALQDFLVGGITENTLADAITRGFEEGKTAVDDFATYMTDVLKNAAVEIFKADLLNSPEMVEYMAYVKGAYNDGIITALEKTGIDQRAASMAATYTPKWDALTGSIGMKDEEDKRTGSSKGFASMNQDSADELNGRFTAMQGHTFRMADSLDILKANSSALLGHVIQIKGHTESMQGGIQRMEGTLDSVKLGIDTINLKGITIKR